MLQSFSPLPAQLAPGYATGMQTQHVTVLAVCFSLAYSVQDCVTPTHSWVMPATLQTVNNS